MGQTVITDREGRRVKAELLEETEQGQQIKLEDGRVLFIAHDALVRERSGDALLLGSWDELEAGAAEQAVIPLVEETLHVDKREVERGRVRIRTEVRERQETIDETLMHEEVIVERVKVGRVVDAPEPVRYEGELTIIPLYEEVMVVEKRLMLTEELHVRKERSERRDPQQVTLRREEAIIERLEGHSEGTGIEGVDLQGSEEGGEGM